ncbi:hypothetical protein TRIP_C20013 [Candidatus Zixiibacteriota bacterium]|nr:hypothetical protein TRIP_C20013 [candidate division Zixibacteria bacterium]
MEKLSKLLLLINLLHNREIVTVAEIKQLCHISERSVYRYVNAISAAHFPVFYDHRLAGYRLISKTTNRLEKFGFDEALILVVALELLAAKVNADYEAIIESVASKILANQNIALEAVLEVFKPTLAKWIASNDVSRLLSELILGIGIQSSMRMRIALKEGPIKFVELDKAFLNFDQNWNLCSNDINDSKVFALANIKTVQAC